MAITAINEKLSSDESYEDKDEKVLHNKFQQRRFVPMKMDGLVLCVNEINHEAQTAVR